MMKIISFPITSSFLLFSILIINSLFNSAAEALGPPVLDIAGENIKPGPDNFYLILPFITNDGGGLTQASAGNQTCPLAVVQYESPLDTGMAVWFNELMYPPGEVIHESTILNIQFIGTYAFCNETSVWKRDEYPDSLGRFFITTGGVSGFHGVDFYITSRFMIEKSTSISYKLVYCPPCAFCDHVCGDIGIVEQDGVRRLALSDKPFPVVFRKASTVLRTVVE